MHNDYFYNNLVKSTEKKIGLFDLPRFGFLTS